MILAFADLHLGNTGAYSKLGPDGFYTAESDAITALEYIYEQSKLPEIDCIIFTGDFFHTSHPSTRNIAVVINWLNKMDLLNKPFYLIPGNHDTTNYYNSLSYTHEITYKNIKFIDDKSEIKTYTWNNYTLNFIPHVQDLDSKAKDSSVKNSLSEVLLNLKDNSIVISHLVESGAASGSEAYLLAKKVDTFDFSNSNKYKNTIFLLGHIHRPQLYTKSNGIQVVYPGSTTYQDASDLNQVKGYITISETGVIEFKTIPTIRKFMQYTIVPDKEPLEYLESIRLHKQSVIFLRMFIDYVPTPELLSFLKDKDITLGKIISKKEQLSTDTIVIDSKKSDPYDQYTDFIQQLGIDTVLKQDYVNFGKELIDTFISGGCK